MRRGGKQIQIRKELPQSIKGYGNNGYSFFHVVITVRNKPLFPQAEKYPTTILHNPISRQVTKENHISARKPINHINPYHRMAKSMDKNAGKNNVPLFSQILDYYSTTDKYIRSKTHSNAHQSVFTKENDKYQRFVLEQKSQYGAGVRQTSNHGTITAGDNYELTRNLHKCVGVERLCEGANFQIPFHKDKVSQSKGTGKTAGSCRGKKAQNPYQGKGGYDKEHKDSLLKYPGLKERMQSLLQNGGKITPKQWKAGIKSL